eukprot:9312885-Alexandrium_andersonii.AAC.1
MGYTGDSIASEADFAARLRKVPAEQQVALALPPPARSQQPAVAEDSASAKPAPADASVAQPPTATPEPELEPLSSIRCMWAAEDEVACIPSLSFAHMLLQLDVYINDLAFHSKDPSKVKCDTGTTKIKAD